MEECFNRMIVPSIKDCIVLYNTSLNVPRDAIKFARVLVNDDVIQSKLRLYILPFDNSECAITPFELSCIPSECN